MTDAPLSLAFFDPARGLHGMARAGITLLFEGRTPKALPSGPEIVERGDAYHATLEDRLDLVFTAVSEAAAVGGGRTRICRVVGTVDGTSIDCLGTVTETTSAPAWAELDALRAISAIFAPEHAVLAVARRPRGVLGHGHELVSAVILAGGEEQGVEDARLSTVYDADGRQRSAGLELWMPAEDFPRRASGEVVAGTTLDLPGLQVNAAIFAWRMDGREGAGAYDVTVRSEPPEAA